MLRDYGESAYKEFIWLGEQYFDKHKREIEILMRLRHPNIVQLYGIVWDGIDKYRFLGYVMEFVKGGSLHDVIYNHAKSYDFHQICLGIEQIARGLMFLHNNGIIHRDVKPENILVAVNQLKLADFGIAKNFDATTTAGAGTLRYMGPEVLETGKCSPSSDIYSLAIIIWEMFHRKTPYFDRREPTDMALLNKIIKGTRPRIDPEKMNPDITALVKRCWHTNAENRPEIKEVVDYFETHGTLHNQLARPLAAPLLYGHLSSPKEPSTILVLGGFNSEHSRFNMTVLNSNRSKWITLYVEPVPPQWPREECAVYLNEEIYLFGCSPRTFFKLDKISLKWIQLADMNMSRSRIVNSCLAWDGYIWVFGGNGGENIGSPKSVERYDPRENAWTMMPDMKYVREGAAATVWNGRIIIAGGLDNTFERSTHRRTNTVECVDPRDGSWTELPRMPSSLNGHSLVAYKEKIIVIGGDYWLDGSFNVVWELEPDGRNPKWTPLTPKKYNTRKIATTVFESEVYAIGGLQGMGNRGLHKVEVFNGQKWRKGPSLPCEWYKMSAVIIPQTFADLLSRECKVEEPDNNKCIISYGAWDIVCFPPQLEPSSRPFSRCPRVARATNQGACTCSLFLFIPAMKLRYLSSILPQQEGASRICGVSCSSAGLKTAVAGSDRSILLLDEKGEQRDKFATKPIESKFGKKSYIIKCVAFSPDGSKIAIGQTDNVVFVYKIGTSWNEKKVIVNKLMQTSAVTALDWPFDDKLLIGLMDGKVRVGLIKSNKCSSLYKTDQGIVSMQSNPKRTAFVSGHLDGSVILYNFSTKSQSKILNLQLAPYCLAFTAHGLLIGGSDRRILSYTETGVIQQQFDYTDQGEKEFSACAVDPTGQNVVVASYDRLRLFSWSSRRGAWDEGAPLEIQNLYAVTALGWKGDGSAIFCGTLCGGVVAIDCCLRRGMLKSRFETTYVAPSHVIVRDVNSESRTDVISHKGLAIDDLKMMGKDRYVVATTSTTLILADTETGKSSEIDWHSGGNEKYYFEFAHVCLLINAGEITVVEYGTDGPLGWVRTELTNPHLLSVRIVTRESGHGNVKKMAYLPDPTTIALQNFLTGDQELSLTHTAPIDWLELNESATKLLFRDKRSRVTLVDLDTQRKTNLLSFCSYVQWVPLSDVVVAQSGETLHIWYNPDLPEQVTTIMIRGDVEDVLRDADRTEVIVQESTSKIAYELDNTQIEFGTALEQRDFERAIAFLESNAGNMDTYTMWRRVADLALEQHNLLVAQRCFAAINDVARVNLLHDTIEIATKAAQELGGDGTQHYKVRANLARMAKKFKEAEKIYMQQNSVEEAIEMYQTLHKWDEALELAKATNYPGYEQLKATYYRALFDTGQEAKAAELKISDGDVQGAVQLYLKGNQPAKALAAALADSNLANDQALMQNIAQALLKGHVYNKAGDLFERMKDFEKALECYKKAKSYAKAVELARFAFPEQVVALHEEWGDHLVLEGQDDTAINHYLESNKTLKAVEAAMKAKEWNKAVQIVDVIQDQNTSRQYYGKIADHYASVGDYERAERLFIEADLPQDAITMYLRNNKWADAYRLSVEFLGKDETHGIYERKAAELEEQGRLTEAEQLYISIGLSEKAIQMYMAAGRNEDVVRLVERYHGEHIQETHKRLGMEHEERGDYKAAEEEYLKADDWQAAINMYRSQDIWNDAFRLAKSEGNENSQKQVIFLWASSLGGEAAVKLLNKHGMLQTAIDLAIERGSHDFAFDLSKLGAKERLPEVHKNLAHQLEDAGKLDEAARHYIEGGFPNEAVEMYLHVEDFAEAEKIAKEHSPDALKKVYEAQALLALKDGDHAKAESFLLRANRPDIILRYFKEQGMWPDALRIAKEFLPNQLPQLQEEYDKAELRSGARGVDSYVAQAKEFEGQSDWARAVQTYLKVSPEATENMELVKQCTQKAADISIRFLMGGDQQLLEHVIERLEEVQLYEKLAEFLLTMGNTPKAVMSLCKAQQWSKAKQIASEYQPALIPEIEAAYKESLRNEGRLGELIDVDVISAIELLIDRGQWEKALDTAKQTKHTPLLDKYVAQYAAELLPHGDFGRLMKVFEKYGASANPTNFNLYRAILEQAVEHKRDSPALEYERVAPVRNLFLNIVESMRRDDSQYLEAFERFVHALNLLTLRSALEMTESTDAPRLRLKQSLSLLRYTDILPVDRIFYEAGVAAKEYGQGYENVAFVLLNHYLDLVDAIDEGNAELVDYAVFEGTDIPTEIELPQQQWTESSEHEEIKEWVLATSVDDAAQRELLLDRRGAFEASLIDANGQSYEPCIITGYPVIASPIRVGDLMADREELNRFLIIVKTSQSDQLIDAQDFMSKWAKGALAMAL